MRKSRDIINWSKIMITLSKTISFIIILSLCESALQNLLKNESTPKFQEYEDRESALTRNGSKTDDELYGGE